MESVSRKQLRGTEPVQRQPESRSADRPTLRLVKGLSNLDDSGLLQIIRQPRADGKGSAAFELLVARYEPLVRACAHRYRNSPEPAEDLLQVGFLGLVKAIRNFDPARGSGLAGYARACVTGELRRHFRDKRWQVHVERTTQERVAEVRTAAGQLAQRLGRQPSAADLARHLGMTGTELAQARQAEAARQPCSLDARLASAPGSASRTSLLGADDPDIERVINLNSLATHWHELSPRDRRILVMRYFGGMTQDAIGRRLGISQMQVSRLLSRSLGYLRQRLTGATNGRGMRLPKSA